MSGPSAGGLAWGAPDVCALGILRPVPRPLTVPQGTHCDLVTVNVPNTPSWPEPEHTLHQPPVDGEVGGLGVLISPPGVLSGGVGSHRQTRGQAEGSRD